MDKYFPALLASLLLANVPSALASSQAELSVSGVITPKACTPGLAEGGTIDHGKVTVRDLNQDRDTLLPRNTLHLNVRCEGSTLFAMTTIDNRHGTSVIPNHHGLGTTPNDEKLGSVSLSLSNPMADTMAVRTIVSLDGGTTWTPGTQLGHLNLLAVAAMDNPTQPMAVTIFEADIVLYTRIARADGLTLTDEVLVDGHATLEMKYL
ncbi:DUF1120 domain-containing protein [Pseudomonas veronii]|uniref:DUF1120 domain-containing protein n=2 Tax=Gammaproteobacteria TaxID=1236 RepID=A0ABS0VGA1_PSEVE|nr:DUF1120 domain-containing protein [Pseudomonas veronii]MBI6553116.1 DUF1120 domain-containing protein [Pseudomonas veronii]MBI6650541.1 DUF1120 domain-containing protein [Pseudomonas veronii]